MAGPPSREVVDTFLERLASDAPTPGGGSAAALAGALGAALVSMVGRLTLGKSQYATDEAELTAMVTQSEGLRRRLTSFVDADARAFEHVTQAMQMPRDTDEAREARTTALQDALKAATVVPLQIADACREVMALAELAAARGNPNVISDAGVAMLMAESGLRSAALNVLINLKWIKDAGFVAKHRDQLETLMEGAPQQREDHYTKIVGDLL
jgi:methenyltetrahydrofolate cyclohydrolase